MLRRTSLDKHLAEQAQARRLAGHWRVLPEEGHASVNLASNDYLGLRHHPHVLARAHEALDVWGTGAGSSRLVTGNLLVHTELEQSLARLTGAEGTLVFSSGYAANLAAVTGLADADTLVVSDAHAHASLVDGCRLSRAQVTVVGHGDLDAIAQLLATRHQARALVVVESVYSVLGDSAPIAELVNLVEGYDATLLVDEAHGIGVVGAGGCGGVSAVGMGARRSVVRTGALGKSLASQGGFVAASQVVIDHLVNAGRSFVYDTGLAPASAAAALGALEVLQTAPQLADRVRERAAKLCEAAGIVPVAGAVCSVPMASAGAAMEAVGEAARRGVRIGCFRPPSTPDQVSRLRWAANAALNDEQLELACRVLQEVTMQGARGRTTG